MAKDWAHFFFSSPPPRQVMPEKGKGKGHAGHDGRVGGSSFGGENLSHEPRAPKKTKSQMCAEQIFLKWMQSDEFRKGVAFVEDKNKRWTTICTHISGGDLLKDTTLRALINQGFQPNVSSAATAASSQAVSSSAATAASSPAASCAFQVRLQTLHAPAHYDQSRVLLSMGCM